MALPKERTPVSIPFSILSRFCSEELSEVDCKTVLTAIEKGYGPEGLGVLLITGVPGYAAARSQLLPLASVFAGLDESIRNSCKDPQSGFQIGWSHGIEKLQKGQADTLKGSYYANPITNTPSQDAAVIEAYPVYARPNVWPGKDLPELEKAFMRLGKIIADVGILVAKTCDTYLATKQVSPSLEVMLKRSFCCKGRLLHYFPTVGCEPPSKWCATHCDHGTLTGICGAMYLDKYHSAVPTPDPGAGLYVISPTKTETKIHIPPDGLAFQLGQTAQILSNGFLRATPHFVKAAHSADYSRNTFACFLQPNWDEPMTTDVDPTRFGIQAAQWRPGCNFGEFAASTVKCFHDAEDPA